MALTVSGFGTRPAPLRWLDDLDLDTQMGVYQHPPHGKRPTSPITPPRADHFFSASDYSVPRQDHRRARSAFEKERARRRGMRRLGRRSTTRAVDSSTAERVGTSRALGAVRHVSEYAPSLIQYGTYEIRRAERSVCRRDVDPPSECRGQCASYGRAGTAPCAGAQGCLTAGFVHGVQWYMRGPCSRCDVLTESPAPAAMSDAERSMHGVLECRRPPPGRRHVLRVTRPFWQQGTLLILPHCHPACRPWGLGASCSPARRVPPVAWVGCAALEHPSVGPAARSACLAVRALSVHLLISSESLSSLPLSQRRLRGESE